MLENIKKLSGGCSYKKKRQEEIGQFRRSLTVLKVKRDEGEFPSRPVLKRARSTHVPVFSTYLRNKPLMGEKDAERET